MLDVDEMISAVQSIDLTAVSVCSASSSCFHPLFIQLYAFSSPLPSRSPIRFGFQSEAPCYRCRSPYNTTHVARNAQPSMTTMMTTTLLSVGHGHNVVSLLMLVVEMVEISTPCPECNRSPHTHTQIHTYTQSEAIRFVKERGYHPQYAAGI